MSDLYPTKTRLLLLRDVANGDCTRRRDYRGEEYDHNSATDRTVTVRLAELERAGWVVLGKPCEPVSRYPCWRLTPAGRAVLDAHAGAR